MMPDNAMPPNRAGGLFLSDDELERLQELMWAGYPFAYVLYVQELRRYMDARTGVVGDRRKVCEQGMRETLERESKRGPDGAPKVRSRHFVQRQLKALVKYGLVERLPKGGRFSAMRFFLPLAVPGLKGPQEMRTVMRTVMRTGDDQKTSTVTDASALFRPDGERKSALKCAQHQEVLQEEHREALSMDDLRQVDLAMVVRLYHEILVPLKVPPLRVWDTTGYRHLVARVWFMGDDGRHQTEAFWRAYFQQVAGSDFLTGRQATRGRDRFKGNFKFLVDPDRVIKTLNGEYT